MNKIQLANLMRTYSGQRNFSAKKEGYEFDLFCDSWSLGYQHTLHLEWMHELIIEESTFIDLRLSLSHAAKFSASTSMITIGSRLKFILNHLEINTFEALWLTIDDNTKKGIKNTLHTLCSTYPSKILQPLYHFVKNISLKDKNNTNTILDSKKGAYSEIEQENIMEALRLETSRCLTDKISSTVDFNRLCTIITSQLMTAVTRRPTQLRQIKWCDILPVGEKFINHKMSNHNWMPLTQHLFSDVEQLHLRTFKGKDGEYRYFVESRTHRLEPNFSQLILLYFRNYQKILTRQLILKGIELNTDEIKELMMRLPLLPETKLFKSNFLSKEELFKSVSVTSEAYHQSSANIIMRMKSLFRKLNVVSDRHPIEVLKLSNNRWRHTLLTQAALQGFTPAQISNITGVNIESISPYLDLKFKERVKIDEIYAGNHIIERFDSISVRELQNKSGFRVRNEFDEEIGYHLDPTNCNSCESKLGAPMACYPCDNFRPLETANHQQYLNKAERKLEINSRSGHPATLRKLKKIITYINATIIVCNNRATFKLEDDNDCIK